MLSDLSLYYYNQGLHFFSNNRVTLAKNSLEKAVAMSKEDWKRKNVLGLCYYRLGDFSAAKEIWAASLCCSPGENPASFYLKSLKEEGFLLLCQKYNEALLSARDGEHKKAERLLRDKKVSCFSFVSFINLLGLCLYAQGKKNKALRVWAQALTIDQEHPLTLKYLQQSLIKSGRVNTPEELGKKEGLRKWLHNLFRSAKGKI